MGLKEPEVYIRMMGSFSISVAGKVNDRMMTDSPKGLSLIELLYLADEVPVPSMELYRQLWADDAAMPGFDTDKKQQERAKGRLKTLVSRTRKYLNTLLPGLGKCIASAPRAYAWQSLPNVTVDVQEVDAICAAINSVPSFDEEKRLLAEQLISTFHRGLYLTGDWLDGYKESARLWQEYRDAVFRYLRFLERKGEYSRVYLICRDELKADPDNKELRRIQHVALVRLKEKRFSVPKEPPADTAKESLPARKKREAFSADQAAYLSALPAVEKVTEKTVKFTKEFKAHFSREYEKGKNGRQIFEEAGVDPEIVGWGRIYALSREAEKQINRNQPASKKRSNPDRKSDRINRKILELEIEIDNLRQRLREQEQE